MTQTTTTQTPVRPAAPAPSPTSQRGDTRKSALRGKSYAAGAQALTPEDASQPAPAAVAAPPSGGLANAASGGAAELPFRARMEASFGQDFSKVRAFVGRAEQLAELGARAAADGETVVFGTATPTPEMVAHELAHVVQNRVHAAGGGGAAQDAVSERADDAEREAEAVASRAAAGERVRVTARPAGRVQRMTGLLPEQTVWINFKGKHAGVVVEAIDDSDYTIRFEGTAPEGVEVDEDNCAKVPEYYVVKRAAPRPVVVYQPQKQAKAEREAIGQFAMKMGNKWEAISTLSDWETRRDRRMPDKGIEVPKEWKELDLIAQKLHFCSSLRPKLYQEVTLEVYENEDLTWLLHELSVMKKTGLQPQASTDHTWGAMAATQLDNLGKLGYAPGKGVANLKEKQILEVGRDYDKKAYPTKGEHGGLPRTTLETVCPGLGDFEILGRTIIFHPTDHHRFVAVKIAKKDEDLDELAKEGGMQRILNIAKGCKLGQKHAQEDALRLGLDPELLAQIDIKSTFPEPVGVFMIEMPSKEYAKKAAEGIGSRGIEDRYTKEGGELYPCFVYKTDDYEYFRYINRAIDKRTTVGDKSGDCGLRPDELDEGMKGSMHDIFALASESWMFTQLIDLYHHNAGGDVNKDHAKKTKFLKGSNEDMRLSDGGGRLLILLDLLRKVRRDRGDLATGTSGLGRVDNIDNAVGYPNVRKTGVADVGDSRSFEEIMEKVDELHQFLSEMMQQKDAPDTKRTNPWEWAFDKVKGTPQGSKLGFQKPDVDLALDLGAALRRYDAAVTAVSKGEASATVAKESGFSVKELEVGKVNRKDGHELVLGALFVGVGWDRDEERKKHRHDLVFKAFVSLYDPKQDEGEELAKGEKIKEAEWARDELGEAKKTKDHETQQSEHEVYKDVAHLLYPAEQSSGAVRPYVMASYLGEYLVSHLLLTGTYFCRDEEMALTLKKELDLGPKANEGCKVLGLLRKTLLEGCVEAVMGYSGCELTDRGAITGVLERIADFWMLARQTAFFMTDKYLDHILEGETPILGEGDEKETDSGPYELKDRKAMGHMKELGIFHEKDAIDIDTYEGAHKLIARRPHHNSKWNQMVKDKLHKGMGSDLGPNNGLMPIKEFEALAYRLVPYLMVKHHQTRSDGKGRYAKGK